MQYLRSSERFVYDKFIRSTMLEFVCFPWVFLKREYSFENINKVKTEKHHSNESAYFCIMKIIHQITKSVVRLALVQAYLKMILQIVSCSHFASMLK